MRVGYLVPEFPTQTHSMFWREVAALRALGVSVRLLSTRRPKQRSCPHAFAGEAAAETYYLFPPRWAAALKLLIRRPRRAAEALGYLTRQGESSLLVRMKRLGLLVWAADLSILAEREALEHIHIHSCAESAHIGALCRILGGPPYSLTLHGDLSIYGADHRGKMARAAFICCAGKHLEQQIVESAGIPVGRVVDTWMGIDTAQFRALPRVHREGVLEVITVARLDECKGHRHALAAIRRAVDRGCDIRYTIVGEGPQRQQIEADIRELRLGDRVRLTGSVGEAGVIKLLQSADCFVLPSVGLGEAFPVSVMEATACGLPVIASIIGATPLMIEQEKTGILVEQTHEDALAAAAVATVGGWLAEAADNETSSTWMYELPLVGVVYPISITTCVLLPLLKLGVLICS